MSDQKKSMPFPVPLGGGKNRDLITAGGKGKHFLNTIARGRLTEEDSIDITILNSIAGNDAAHCEFVETFVAATIAIDGRARLEHLQSLIGVGIPSWGITSNNGDDPEKKRRMFKFRRNHDQSEEDRDA